MQLSLRNPMFKSFENSDSYYEDSASCTLPGIFGKTLLLVLVALAGAVAAIAFLFRLTDENIGTFLILLVVSSITALVSCLIARFSVTLCPVFSFIYCISEGFLLGVISLIVDLYYGGVAITALIATVVVTITLGILYFTGIVKVGHKLKAFVIACLIGMVVLALVNIILNATGFTGAGEVIYGSTPLGWAISIIAVLFACALLLFDFDYCADMVERELDKKYEWRAAFILTVGIIYLYLKILEILVKIAAASKK